MSLFGKRHRFGVHPVPQPASEPVPGLQSPAEPEPPREPQRESRPEPRPPEQLPAPGPLPVADHVKGPPGPAEIRQAYVVAGVIAAGVLLSFVAVILVIGTAMISSYGPGDLPDPSVTPYYSNTDIDAAARAVLEKRAAEEYPDFELQDMLASPQSAAKVYYVTLKSLKQPTLTYVAVYEGWEGTASAGTVDLTNKDRIIQRGADFNRYADGLLAAVAREHGSNPITVASVLVADLPMSSPIPFDVLIEVPAASYGTERSWEVYDLDSGKGTWTRSADVPGEDGESAAPSNDPASVAAFEEKIRAQVARVYPSYRVTDTRSRVIPDSWELGGSKREVYIVLEHRNLPGFRWVSATGYDDYSFAQTAALFGPKYAVRGDAFARAWRKAHPGSVVWEVIASSGEVTDNTVLVRYFDTVDDMLAVGKQPHEATMRYDPGRRVWSQAP